MQHYATKKWLALGSVLILFGVLVLWWVVQLTLSGAMSPLGYALYIPLGLGPAVLGAWLLLRPPAPAGK